VELVDNQVTPLRGLGRHILPLAGVGQRLSNGQRLALLVYGAHEQYLLNGSVALQPAATTVMPVTLSGTVAMPLHKADLPTP
jgi:ABC-2 type transport system ATP-binding protein